LLRRHVNDDAVIALDDFEGVEKGVANLMNMRAAEFIRDPVVVYPCSNELLAAHGLRDGSSTALLIPRSLIRLTAQAG